MTTRSQLETYLATVDGLHDNDAQFLLSKINEYPWLATAPNMDPRPPDVENCGDFVSARLRQGRRMYGFKSAECRDHFVSTYSHANTLPFLK